MELNEYKKIIEQTAVYPKEFGKGYVALGLLEEWSEYVNSKTYIEKVSELGDIMWYVVSCCKEWNIDIEDIFIYQVINGIFWYPEFPVNIIAGKTKKYYRDGTDYTKEMKEGLAKVLHWILNECKKEHISFSEMLSKNYEKLIKRRETNTIHGEGNNRENKL